MLTAESGPPIFSSSHSDDLALIGLGPVERFAVDIERVRRIDDFAAVAARFFTPHELAAIGDPGDAHALDRFYRCWVLKEAFVKALGEGLSHPLDSFSVDITTDPPRLVSTATGDPSDWRFGLIQPRPGWIAAIACAAGSLGPIDLRSWSFDTLP
ncbi:MAG: 4'-phosphopantetheinyl transferase superfamily protein [Alphaproteobacteria bacterium]|nr:4'-phosphopantetheinyl transferase superfamily protein [Alphaproteobacteria bacterium]